MRKNEDLNLGKLEAVIYDLDGTLVDSERLWHEAETELLAVRGFTYRAEVRAALLGKRLDACIRIIREAYALPESEKALLQELLTRMMKLVDEKLQIRPGAEELLAEVQALGLKTAIASSSPLEFIEGVVRACHWQSRYFPEQRNCLFSADGVPAGKPAPDVYLAAAAALGVEPANCLAIEDSATGARSAVAAGMLCFAVWDEFHSSAADFADITPHCFASLRDCIPAIRQRVRPQE